MKDLINFLKNKYNYNETERQMMQPYVDKWKSWYEGDVKDFHNYYTYNGIADIPVHRYTLNMAKQISEDWSDILWSEKCKVSLKDERNQKEYDELINKLDLNVLINQSIEKSGALGTCAAVVSVYDLKQNNDAMILDVSDAKTRVDIVDVDWIFPITWNNKEITECAFGSTEYFGGKKYIILSVHKKNDKGIYHIHNHLFLENKGTLTEVPFNNVMSDFDTKSDKKWFAIFKPMITNNLFSHNPYGIPHYANSIDTLKAIDISFDALKTEVEDGVRKTFVRADMLTYEDGTEKRVFKPSDKRYHILPKGANKDDLIQSDNDDLRTDKQIETLNTNLNILGVQVGLGENKYHFSGAVLTTATAVVSANSTLFRRKKKLEIGYESAIFDLVNAVCYASSAYGKYNIDTADMVIQFDDSIIEDKEAESNRALREVNAGLISKSEYRQKIFGETPEIAEENIRKINEENPSVEQLIGNSNEE